MLEVNTIPSLNSNAPNVFSSGRLLNTSTTIISMRVHNNAIDKIVLNRYFLTELIFEDIVLPVFIQCPVNKDK